MTARTAAYAVTGEKGAARLAYLAARFGERCGGRAAGCVDRRSAETQRDGTLRDRVRWRFPRPSVTPAPCPASDIGPRYRIAAAKELPSDCQRGFGFG
jgi:hypothetical protein